LFVIVLLHISIDDDGEQRLVFIFEYGEVTGVLITDEAEFGTRKNKEDHLLRITE
jgi:hypothetical protein